MKKRKRKEVDRLQLRAAALASLILTCASFFTFFLPDWSYYRVSSNIWEFIYSAVRFIGAEFSTNLVFFLGLDALTRRYGRKH